MTTVDIVYRYATAPTERVAAALAHARDVYGIRKLSFDAASRTLRIEYDATRLNAAAVVTRLVREAGLDIADEESVLLATRTGHCTATDRVNLLRCRSNRALSLQFCSAALALHCRSGLDTLTEVRRLRPEAARVRP